MITQEQLASYLRDIMPDIGFLDKRRRQLAFWEVTLKVEKLVSDEEINEAIAYGALSLLFEHHKPFQKATTMVAINLHTYGIGEIPAIDDKNPIGKIFVAHVKAQFNL